MVHLLDVLCRCVRHGVALGDVIFVLFGTPAEVSAFANVCRFAVGAWDFVDRTGEALPREGILHVGRVTLELACWHMRDLHTTFSEETSKGFTSRQLLHKDMTLVYRTLLNVTELCTLLRFCPSNTCFSYKGKFYRQVFGTAMGESISVTTANITMEAIENKALELF